MRLYLIRHAESEGNREGRIQGSTDRPLTPRGIEQASALAARLAARGIVRVYTSPLARARQTAAILCAAWGAPQVSHDDLRELDIGQLAGLTWEEVCDQHPGLARQLAKGRDADVGFPGGESFGGFYARVRRCYAFLCGLEGPGPVAAVSHGWFLNGLLRIAEGQPLEGPNRVLPNCSVQEILVEDGRSEVARSEVSLQGYGDRGGQFWNFGA